MNKSRVTAKTATVTKEYLLTKLTNLIITVKFMLAMSTSSKNKSFCIFFHYILANFNITTGKHGNNI